MIYRTKSVYRRLCVKPETGCASSRSVGRLISYDDNVNDTYNPQDPDSERKSRPFRLYFAMHRMGDEVL